MRTPLLALAAASICGLALVSSAGPPGRPCQARATAGEARLAAPPKQRAQRPRVQDAVARRLLDYQAEVARATVLVLDDSCAGFVAEAPNLVVTAAHCIPYPRRRVGVRGPSGETLVAHLDRIDRDTDLALLSLTEPLPVVPLVLSQQVPAAGDRLMFVGRGDRRSKPQLARVDKLDRCPSLPRVPNALFTSVAARPGDSGAPLVDASLRVVGLVHGGARCHIAAPVAPLAWQLMSDRRAIFAGQWLPSAPWPRGGWAGQTGPRSKSTQPDTWRTSGFPALAETAVPPSSSPIF